MQEEPEHTGEGDYVDAFVQKLVLGESAIMQASLYDNSKFALIILKGKPFINRQKNNFINPLKLYSRTTTF